MSYSAHYFDTAHSVAHIIKDTGYFINIIGLALSSIQYNKDLRNMNRKLIESNKLLSQQNEKIRESEKMKEEFINIAAHELRTPIQPIIGLVEDIYSNSKDEEQKEILEIIRRNADRLKRLTDNVLDVTKIEGKSLELKKEKLNLNVLITEILKDYYSNKKIKQQMKKIVYNFKDKHDIFVEADRDRLAQVLHNLLDNALKFTKLGQIIFIFIDKKKDKGEKEEVIVSVMDTGEGISESILPKLFTKLTIGTSSSGTGLGLYISKNIIEAHGGKMWAENNLDSKGALFRFTLPISSIL
jgi:signal transduction histidine kinase